MVPGSAAGSGRFVRARWLVPVLCLLLPSVVDAQRNRTSRVPVNHGQGSFGHVSTSTDGRFLAYYSDDPNLTKQPAGASEIFVHDRRSGTTTALGLAANGAQNYLGHHAISDDGRIVVFNSTATTLVSGDTNGAQDVYLLDRGTGQVRRVSVGPAGQQSPYGGWDGTISGDGRFVAFTAYPNLTDESGGPAQYVFDRTNDQLQMVSRRQGSGLAGTSTGGTISRDGRYVTFGSTEPLLPGDTNQTYDIYVFDRQAGTLALASLSTTGSQGTAILTSPVISANGRFVAFHAWADGVQLVPEDTNGLGDVIVRDRDADQDGVYDEPGAVRTILVSMSDAGVPGNQTSFWHDISDSGRIVSFASAADNLLGPGADQNRSSDVFVVDLDVDGDGLFHEPGDRRIALVSVADDGAPVQSGGGGGGSTSSLSGDGRLAVFSSCANDITPNDTTLCDFFVVDRLAWHVKDLTTATAIALAPQPSGDGTWIAFASSDATLVPGDTNGVTDVFVRDRRKRTAEPGAVVRVSVATNGAQALGGSSDQASISSDGRFVVFRSAATTLVGGDTNGQPDIFLHDRDTDQDGAFDEPGARSTVRINVSTGGSQAVGGASETPRISGNGRYVVYTSAAHLAGGPSAFRQVYFYDRVDGITVCASEHNGVKANADAVTPAVSDTRRVAFATTASNLSTFDTNGLSDVYDVTIGWPYTAPRSVHLASWTGGGSAAGGSTAPALSPSGRLVFVSTAPLTYNDGNGVADVYLESFFSVFPYFTTSTVFLRLSEGPDGQSNGPSGAPSIGANAISFTSSATNLVFGDTNGVDDVFRITTFPGGGGTTIPLQEFRSRLTRVSLRTDGSQSPTPAGLSAISADGQHVEFEQALSMGAALTGRGPVVQPLIGDGKGTSNGPSAEIRSVSPRRGPQSGGTIIDLAGVGLADPDLIPTLGGVPMTVIARGPEFIRAVTPPGAGSHVPGLNGPPDIGKSVVLAALFTYEATPTCTVAAGPASIAAPASGGPIQIDVTDVQRCGWTSRADVEWLGADVSGEGGLGLTLTAQPNPDSSARLAHVTIGASTIEVSQPGASCTYELSSPAAALGPDLGTATVLLRAPLGCPWTAVPNQPWLTIAGVASANGSREIGVLVAENNSTSSRDGSVSVAGLTFAISQAGENFSTLVVTRTAGGRVVSQPAGIDCGASCNASFSTGTALTLTAFAESGYAFDGWSGACGGQEPCQLSMAGDRAVSAAFSAVPRTVHTLRVTVAGAGLVSSNPAGVACEPGCEATFQNGSTVTLAVTPASGWRFASWSGTGCGAVVQMTADRACVATFERGNTDTFALAIAFAGSGGGRVTSAPAGVDCTASCSQPFPADTTVVLTPAPDAGSTFGGWSGDAACVSGAFRLIQSMTCQARFDSTTPPSTLTVSVTGSGRIRSIPAGIDCAAGTCTASFPVKTVVRLLAVPAAGQTLARWGGACIGNTACLIRMDQPRSASASFQPGNGRPIQVTGILPTSGPVEGGTKIRIFGAGFLQLGADGERMAASVVIGTTPALAVDVVSDTEIIAVGGAAPAPGAVVHLGAATVVATSDVTINVAGSLTALPGAWRTVLPDGSLTTDTDGDGMPDQYEAAYSLDMLTADGSADADGDGATNLEEYQAGTHPQGRYTRYLAEGATGTFFDTRLGIANPHTVPATTVIRFQTQSPISPLLVVTVPGQSRRLVYPRALPTLVAANFGSVVESDVQLAVDRQMFWNPVIYGSHAGTSVDAPSLTWYLAEGATHGRFDLFYLLQNPDTRDADVRIRFLRPSLPPVERTYRVPARQRVNVYVDEIPELASTDVSAAIESTNGVPIIVERAMYVTSPTGRAFEGGHESAGVTAPSTRWFLAEGATGSFFDTFVLIANPTASDAQVQARYLLPDGSTVEKAYTVAANSRRTVWVDGEDPRLAATSVSTVVTSTNGVPIIVERSMWWPGIESVQRDPVTFPIMWGEAHNSPGSTETGTAWVVGDGDTGPAPVFTRTYYLIANTSVVQARVRVTLLSDIDLPPLSREFSVPANGRLTVAAADAFPETMNYGFGGFGALIESLPDAGAPDPAQIVVERAMYSNSADGIFWAAGTNILAMKIR